MNRNFDLNLGYWINFLPYSLKENNHTHITREYLVFDRDYNTFFDDFVENLDRCDNKFILNYFSFIRDDEINEKKLSNMNLKVNGEFITLNTLENFIDYFEDYTSFKENINRYDVSTYVPKILKIPNVDTDIENIEDIDMKKIVYPKLPENIPILSSFKFWNLSKLDENDLSLKKLYVITLIESLNMMKQYDNLIFPQISSVCKFLVEDYSDISNINYFQNKMKFSELYDVIVLYEEDETYVKGTVQLNTDENQIIKLNKKYRFVCLVVFIYNDKKFNLEDFDKIERMLILLDNKTKKVYHIYDYDSNIYDNETIHQFTNQILETIGIDKTFSDVVNIFSNKTENEHFNNLKNLEEAGLRDYENVVYIEWSYFLLEIILNNINKINENLIKNTIYILSIAESISIDDLPEQSSSYSDDFSEQYDLFEQYDLPEQSSSYSDDFSSEKELDEDLDRQVEYWIDLIPYVLRGEERMYLQDLRLSKNITERECEKIFNYFSYIQFEEINNDETIRVNGNVVDMSNAIDFLDFNISTELTKDNVLNKNIINPDIPYILQSVYMELQIPDNLNKLFNMVYYTNVLFYNELYVNINKSIDFLDIPSHTFDNIDIINESIQNLEDKKIFIATFGQNIIDFTLYIIPSKSLMFVYINNNDYNINEIKSLKSYFDYELQIIYPYISMSLRNYSIDIFWNIWLVDVCLSNMDFNDINQLIISSIFKIIVEFGLDNYKDIYNNYQLNNSKNVMDEKYIEDMDDIDEVLYSLYTNLEDLY